MEKREKNQHFIWRIRKTAVFLLCAAIWQTTLFVSAPGTVYAGGQETPATNETADPREGTETGEEIASLSLSVEGNTLYIDAEGTWSMIQGTVLFENEGVTVADHGLTHELLDASVQQEKTAIPADNLEDGKYVFGGIFTSVADGIGVTYTGHAFSLTFEDLPGELEVTLLDADGNTVETAVVGGSGAEPSGQEKLRVSTGVKIGIAAAAALAACVAAALYFKRKAAKADIAEEKEKESGI